MKCFYLKIWKNQNNTLHLQRWNLCQYVGNSARARCFDSCVTKCVGNI